MMQALREGTKPILFLVIFFFVVGFLFLDIGGGAVGCDRQDRRVPNAMALVNGQPIPYQIYQQQRQLVLNQQGGNKLTDSQVLDLEARTYQQLIEDLLIKQAAEARGLGTDLDEVLDVLRTNPPQEIVVSPLFQTDGQFDVSKYYQALGDQRFLSNLVGNYLENLPRTKLNDEIGGTAKASSNEILETHASRKQQSTISFVRVRPGAYGPPPTSLEPARVSAWYEANRSKYDIENAVVVSYVMVQRSPSQLDSVETREIMDSIYAELEANEPFDELMDVHSESSLGMRGGPTGTWLRAGTPLLTYELGEVLSGLSEGEYSKPFADLYGLHVVQLDSTRTGEDGSTEYRVKDIQVRIEISATTEQDVERRLIGIWEAMKGGADFTAVADTAGLIVRTSEAIDLDAGRVVVPGLPNYVEITDLLLHAEAGAVSEVIKGTGGWFIFHIDSRGSQPAPPLANIEPRVRNDMVAEIGMARAQELTGTLTDRLRDGADIDALAAVDTSLTVQTTRPFVRYFRIPEIGREPAVSGAAFAAEIGTTVGAIEGTDGSQYFIRVDERDPDPLSLTGPERDELIAGLRESYLAMKRTEILGSFLRETRAAAEIDDYRTVRTGTPPR